MFQVEKNIPMPPAQKGHRRHVGHAKLYPFAQMEVGDSFLVECPSENRIRTRQLILMAYRRWQQRHNLSEFASRAVEGGVRTWRTK
jgi:hypothetical protein